jgi:hypothetical protein
VCVCVCVLGFQNVGLALVLPDEEENFEQTLFARPVINSYGKSRIRAAAITVFRTEDSTAKMASHNGNQSFSILTLRKAPSGLRTVSLAGDRLSVRARGRRVAGNVGVCLITRFLSQEFKSQKKLL